jgi:hypothetical protein
MLTQVVDDPFFLDMLGYSSMGVTTGVLDDDGVFLALLALLVQQYKY